MPRAVSERERAEAGLMRAIVLDTAERRLSLEEVPTPAPGEGEALVRTLLTGIDGTDEEVVRGEHGEPPPGESRLVLGHECLGEVVHAPEESGFAAGDRVVPLVRHGCGMCRTCRYDASDMCPNESYQEHGIKGLDGFMRDAWTDDPATLVRAPERLGDAAVLAEPLSIVVKALEEARLMQRRIPWFRDEGEFLGQRALVAGTGSLGSLAALLLRDEGMDVWAMDRHGDDTPAARLLGDVGARHFNARERGVREVAREVGGFDLVVEATGAPEVVFDAVLALGGNGILAMLGVPPEKPPFPVEGDAIMRRMVLENQVLFGSVNSNRAHFEEAMRRLLRIRGRWEDALDRVITRRYAPEAYEEAFCGEDEGVIKKAIDWR
jgi:threonine dehydrogenase-like Zn-dependent dehydrogenase